MSILSSIRESDAITLIETPTLIIESCDNAIPYLIDSDTVQNIDLKERASTQLIVINSGCQLPLTIDLAESSKLDIIEIQSDNSSREINIKQGGNSEYNHLSINLDSSSSKLLVDMVGQGSTCRVNTLHMLSGQQQSSTNITITHSVARCNSDVQSKILVSGSAKAELKVRAIVVEGAQESVANQSLRSIELNDGARAVVWPELEIYADDVKCSHGATMGQIDNDAILYMRQRGLSLHQARLVQMEGFIADVTKSVTIKPLEEPLEELIKDKFNEL